jgi:hypothetical protein
MKVKNLKHLLILWAIVVIFDEFFKNIFLQKILNKKFLIELFFEKCQKFITKENH